MPIRRTTPEKRAKRQLAALSATTRRTVKALAKDPDDHRTWDIIDWHDRQVEKIVSPKRKSLPPPPSEFCWTCEKWHPRPVPKSDNPSFLDQCLWAAVITSVFLAVLAVIDWWALAFIPLGWAVSRSFTIPTLFLIVVIVVLGATGIRF
jgi:hypothetical protein